MEDNNTLLSLASQYLLSDDGKKILGEGLDISFIKTQLENQLKINSEVNKSKNISVKSEIRGKKPEVKSQIDQYIPELKEFVIKGRIYDKKENSPLKGAKIEVIIEEPVYFLLKEYSTSTLSDGTFELKLKLPVLPFNQKVLLKPKFLYTKEKYLPGYQEILTLDREPKSDLNLYPLLNLETAAEEELAELINISNSKIQEVNNIALNLPEKVSIARRKAIMNVVSIIQTRLFPLALTLLLAFGITKLTQKNQKICPTRNLLLSNIVKRNKIVKQLNQIYVSISLNTALAAALTIIATQFRTGRLTISSLPIPLATQPYTTVSKLEDTKDVLKELEEQNKNLNRQILIALIFLVASLATILSLLRGIDELTQECAGDLSFEPISQELIDLASDASNEGVISVDKINGFTLEVQTIDQNAVGKLKRRQAIGKNSQGIVLVKGDPSFSSSDQILINELAFYIQSNNLKAF
jgi:hypothetical protein